MNGIVGRLYDCVDDESCWSGVAEALCAALPGSGVAIRDRAGVGTNFYYAGLQRGFVAPAHERKIFNKPWMDRFLRLEEADESVLWLDRLFDVRAFRASDVSGAFLRPDEVLESLAVMLGPARDFRLTVVTRRDPRLADLSALVLGDILPHMKRVYAMRRSSRCVRAGEAAAAVLDRFALGVVVLDARLRIITANESARHLARDKIAITIDASGRFACLDDDAQRRLQALAAQPRAAREEPVVIARRAAVSRSIVISVGRLARDHSGGGAFVVYIHNLEARQSSGGVARLARFLALTPAEQRLLERLGAGERLDEAAASLALSLHTVRNQLRAIFDKAGVQRQVELARLISASGAHDLRGAAG
jgi:DNA-binding CsgD family transcriptional regulator/PAS domain-containing protein